MKQKTIKIALGFTLISMGFILSYSSCRSSRLPVTYPIDTLKTNIEGKGEMLQIEFMRGDEHNHPLMAIWVESINGEYIQTLYVAESIGKGVFGHGDKTTGKWLPGPIRRPAALPVWSHSRGIRESDGLYTPSSDNPMPDAYTGATPPAHFVLLSRADNVLPEKFYIYFEINQTWDWNKYWTNNKYPDDEDYKTSCQPALVYRSVMDKSAGENTRTLELIGHASYNGSNGDINPDLSTITTAKDITASIKAKIYTTE